MTSTPDNMTLTVLGSGTSMGVPTLLCDCPVCRSDDPRDKRLRPGLWLRANGKSILIDVSVDFRQQALVHGVDDVDAVLITHCHTDHIAGLDELRIYNMVHRKRIDFYAGAADVAEIRRRYDYCFNPVQKGGGVPQIELHEIDGPFDLFGLRVVPVPVKHGVLDIFGYRIGPLGIVTDASAISAASIDLLRGVETLLINALRHEPHATHFSLGQALEVSRRIAPRQTYFVHMCHRLGHAETNAQLPPEAQLAYDGLAFELGIRN